MPDSNDFDAPGLQPKTAQPTRKAARPSMTLPRTSFAMVQTAPRVLEPRDIPIPDIDDDGAILRLEACGICGSDYEQFEGVLRTPMPVIPGHEPLGRIAKIGDRAAARWGVDVGDRVAVETMLSCRHCEPCLSGSYHLCDARRIYSYIPLTEAPGLWGGYSQYMYLHPNSVVHRVDPALPPEVGVIFNPLGAGFRWAVEMPNTQPGDTVVILGPGQRGLASVIACRAVGAGTIIVTGIEADERKLALARAFGADHTIDVDNENAVKRVKEITDGRGADVVVDVSAYATKPVADALEHGASRRDRGPGGHEGFQAGRRLRLRPDRDEGDQHPRRHRRHLVGLPSCDSPHRIGHGPGRGHAHPRLRARGRNARDPHAGTRDRRRRVHPLLPDTAEGL